MLDVIRAESESQLDVSRENMMGKLGRAVEELAERLRNLLKMVELSLDFAEEDITLMPEEEMRVELQAIADDMDRLLNSYEQRRVIREGIRVVIVGRPNTGKSSLLNTILGEERVIVTEIPGTTRDHIEERVEYEGTLLQFVDTAGWRRDSDIVGQKGVEITEREIGKADIVLLLMDRSESLKREDREIINKVKKKNILTVLNKKDLNRRLDLKELGILIDSNGCIEISAKTGEGVASLMDVIVKRAVGSPDSWGNGAWLFRERQKEALKRSRDAVIRGLAAPKERLLEECIAIDIRESLDALGEIVGKTTPEHILNKIFEEFCIGK